MKKQSDLSRLMGYAGNYRYFTYAGLRAGGEHPPLRLDGGAANGLCRELRQRQAAQLSDMILFHTRVCENGKKMEQPLENK